MFKNAAIGFFFFFLIFGFFFPQKIQNSNKKNYQKIKHKSKKFKIKYNILTIQTHPENSKSNTTYSQYKHTQKIQNQTQTQKILNQTQHTHNTNTSKKFKIKHNVLQNIGTQTHEYPLIQQNQPKSNSNSIQGTQKHKLRNTKEHKPMKKEERKRKKKRKKLPRKKKEKKKSYPDVKKEER